MRSFLARLCRGQGADDLAQDTFLQAWRMAASFHGHGSYEGWLLRIAWRQFLTRARAPKMETGLEPPAASFFPDPAGAVDLDRALAALSADERAAALLCLGDGYSHGEAAQILDLPLGTLKSIVLRARTKLAAHLSEAADDR